jgi:hypothetical protein
MLNKPALKASLLKLFTSQDTETDLAASREAVADQLATLIDAYVRSATVVIAPSTIQIIAGGTAGTNPAPVRGTLT